MTPPDAKAQDEAKPQRLHLVFGGELKSLESHEFRDPGKLDIVGIFPDFASAERAWRAKAQRRSTARKPATTSPICIAFSSPTSLPPTRTA